MTRTFSILLKRNIGARALMLALYLLFLLVQLAFNYDTGLRPFFQSQASVSQSTGKGLHQFDQGSTHSSIKAKPRLNKRFFPSAIPVVPAFPVQPPLIHVVASDSHPYSSNHYSSFGISAQALRGPPAFV